MNLVRRAAQQLQGAGLSLSDFDRVLDAMYGGMPSVSGKPVSQQTALAVSAVWGCVNVLSNDIATMPFLTFRRTGKGREKAESHYLWDLLMLEANPELASWRWFQLMQAHVLLWGNAFSEITMNDRGQITALWPWLPARTVVSRAYDGGPLQYQYRLRSGALSEPVPRDRMFHLRNFGIDGVMGLSPIEVHKQTVGLSLAMTEHSARFFGQGARPGGVIYTANKLSDTAYQRLNKTWRDTHEGLTNAHRVAILEEGLQWKDVASTMVDADYVSIMGLTQEDICRIYNVPPHRVAILDKATNNNIEDQSLSYVIYSLANWAANWQNQIHSDCLSSRENRSIYVAADFKQLLRGNHAAMAQFLSMLIDRGVISADEAREGYLDMDPQPNGIGQQFFKALNMAPVGEEDKTSPANALTVKKVQPKQQPGQDQNGHAALNGIDLSAASVERIVDRLIELRAA